MDATRKYLEFEYGVMLNWPSFTTYRLNLGEISSYPPGYKENGSVFCHNNPWIMIAETVLGHGNRAFELYRKTAPSYIVDQKLHRTEPYVYAQTINGADSATPGEARNSWLTGTSAWNFYAISQYILGIQPSFKGLKLDPCLPEALKALDIQREFRGNTYLIHIENNTNGEKGKVKIAIDGKPIDGQVIPAPVESGNTYQVTVTVD